MKREQILEKVISTIKDVIDDEQVIIAEKTQAKDVEAWDSLTHVQIIVNLEKQFGLRFKTGDVSRLKRVDELCRYIEHSL